MNEAKLLSDLESANLGLDLVFQVSYADASLVVVINRPQPEPLDYGDIKDRILAIIEKSGLSEPTNIYLYSRILGEDEPDWQDQVLIPIASDPEPQLDSAKTSLAIAAQEEVKDITPKDIAEYRFGLSDYLIETISEPPESDIGEIVIAFDQLSQTNKQILLPALEQFFVNQDRHAFVGLSSELEDLAQKIELLNKRKRRLVSIWVARYCVKGEEILAIVNKSHIQPTKAPIQAEPETPQNIDNTSAVQTSNLLSSSNSPTPNPATNPDSRELKKSSSSSRSSSVPQTNTSVSENSNILPMAIALVVTGILSGWLFNGVYQANGWIAIVGFIHGFIWVVGVSYGNKLFLGSTVFNVVVSFIFRGYLWSQVIGIITGFIFAFAFNLSVKTYNHTSSKLFGKRGAIAFGAILTGMILGITLLGGGGNPKVASSSNPDGGGNILIVEGEILMPELITKATTSSLRIENKGSTACNLTIQTFIVSNGVEDTESTGDETVTSFAQLRPNQSSELPFQLDTGNYRFACQENTSGGASFEVVP
jgi:hypothetical protein